MIYYKNEILFVYIYLFMFGFVEILIFVLWFIEIIICVKWCMCVFVWNDVKRFEYKKKFMLYSIIFKSVY